ncbi:TonB-dependent receptor [Gluconobacter kanchanaburiensis]|uniref:TonB-dependent receptor n=1 Tax=Gluconobacter kanchanaburiensis NBRC 103587 TaxID=1307948 RepID=A0A511B7T2_9PROT|nr:TonB-dependent receptor [Gluconobacter kanchanaburiensis]MBF0862400.1 TonB-dependent receptor [Gluconobacter kanchanaburiensis]GBR68716.1 TonB-dependent receptor [Gluconobacter kanchanaburiensis NBRC 103587]GEK96479.1 TonB-dependent receptor [Gluconobacter kanchanaburiensis NBRC 103587]
MTASRPEEIHVSGQNRRHQLLHVAQSVSTYSGAELRQLNVTKTTDLLGMTPGLYMTTSKLSPSQESTQLVIRGVGTNAQLEPATGIYVDGVYMPALDFDVGFMDPERVDIYKGPQNTQFARNAEAGVVSIVTTPPGEHTVRRARVGLDSFATLTSQLYLSGRIARNLYGSIIADYSRSDGYIKNNGKSKFPLTDPYFPNQDLLALYGSHIKLNRYTGIEQKGGFRTDLRYKPTQRLEFRLVGDYHRDNGNQNGAGPLDSCHCYTVNGDLAYQANSVNYGAAFIASYTLPYVKLSTITSWRESRSDVPLDFVGDSRLQNNLQDIYSEQQSKMQEFRIESVGQRRLTWNAGFTAYKDREYTNRFYMLSDLDSPDGTQHSLYSGIWNSQIVSLRRTGYSGYGELAYAITPRLHLTAGIRYLWEDTSASGLERYVIPANNVLSAPLSSLSSWGGSFNTPALSERRWNRALPSATLRYDLAPSSSVYLRYAQGYKSGSYQKAPVIPSDVSPVLPETTDTYEMGIKSQLNKKILVELAGFDTELHNQQVDSTVVRNGITSNAITNAGASRITGFEANLDWHITPRFDVDANAAYTPSRFLDYVIHPGSGRAAVVRTGSALPSTPDWTANIRGAYTLPLSKTQSLMFQANFRWVNSTYVGTNATSADPILHIPSWNQLDLKVMYRGRRWSASLYGNNVLNRYIVLSKFNTFFALPSGNYIHDVVAPPANVGFDVTANF